MGIGAGTAMVGGTGGPHVLHGCAEQVLLRQPAIGHRGWDNHIVAARVGSDPALAQGKGLGGAADGRVFLAMLSSPGRRPPARRHRRGGHRRGRCHRATSSTPACGASRRPSSPWDAAREALIPWALCAWHRRSGSLATSFLVSGSPLLVQPGVDVAAPVARRPANLDECRAGPLLAPPF